MTNRQKQINDRINKLWKQQNINGVWRTLAARDQYFQLSKDWAAAGQGEQQ